MHRYAFVPVALTLLVACGHSTTPTTTAASPIPTPVTNPSASPNPSGVLWTQAQLTQQSQACASRGDTSVADANSWYTFCLCAYTAAAQNWSFTDFSNNYSNDFNTLVQNGVIDQCLTNAGISE